MVEALLMSGGELPLDSGWRGPTDEGVGDEPSSPTPSGMVLRILLGDTRSGEESMSDDVLESYTIPLDDEETVSERAEEESPHIRALREQFTDNYIHTHGGREGEEEHTLSLVAE